MFLQKMKKSQLLLLLFTLGTIVALITLYLTCLLKMVITVPLEVSYSPVKIAAFIKETEFPTPIYLIFTFVAEIPVFAYIPKMAKRNGSKDVLGRDFYTADENKVYGDAHFEKPEEYKDAALVQNVTDAYGTIFGQLTKDGTELINFRPDDENRLNSHILVVGASGSGKTYTFTKPFAYQAIKRRESVIFTDPDGGLTRDLSNLFRENGYVVRVFDLKNPRKSDGWNCMDAINKSDNMELAAHLFAEAIISNIPGSANTQPIYHDGPLALLKALLLRVAADDQNTFKEKTIRTVYGILQDGGGEEYLNNVIFNPDNLRNNAAKICLGSYNSFKLASDNLRGNLITNLATSLNLLQAGPIADVLSTDGIDLTLPGKQPCAYFCKFPDSHDTYRFIVSLFFSMLFMELVDYADNECGEKLDVPVNFMLDEFPSIGKLPDFQRKMATIRKRNMNVAMIIQDITQLQDLYETAWTTLVSNCSTLFSLGINDEYTADMVAKRIGETTVQVQTKQHQAIENVCTVFYKNSEGQGKRAVLSNDELFKLDKDDCIILFQGHNPIHAYKYPHVLHPSSQNIPRYDMKNRSNITDKTARDEEYREEKEYVDTYLKQHPLSEVDRTYHFILESKEEPSTKEKIISALEEKTNNIKKEKKKKKECKKSKTLLSFDNHSLSEYKADRKREETEEYDDIEEMEEILPAQNPIQNGSLPFEEEPDMSVAAPDNETAPCTAAPVPVRKFNEEAPPFQNHHREQPKTNNAGFGDAPIGQEEEVYIGNVRTKSKDTEKNNFRAYSNTQNGNISGLPPTKKGKKANEACKKRSD